ncbi:MAG: hypothetical protein INF64_03315 [Roseomonas sp.]|nr:hypothetical protein [Roseomonas sp.]
MTLAEQSDRLKDVARDIGSDESFSSLDRIMGQPDLTRKQDTKVWPDFGHLFKGNG